MKRFALWVCDYWWIPALVLAGVGISILGRRAVESVFGTSLSEKLELELEVIEAKREAREWEEKSNTEYAKSKIRSKYADLFSQLSDKERERAIALENDPQQLAKMMARLAKRQK